MIDFSKISDIETIFNKKEDTAHFGLLGKVELVIPEKLENCFENSELFK